MRQLATNRPSPALVISLIALFVALGGSAYAAKKVGTSDIKNKAISTAKLKANAVTTAKVKKNTISTAKLKKNAVTRVKIRKNAVATDKIRADAVTGAKVDESTLSTVPSATNAESAANWSRYKTTGLVKASVGQTVQIAAAAPFTFYGKCVDEGGGIYMAEAYATTSAPKSFLASESSLYDAANFEPGTKATIGYSTLNGGPQWAGYFGGESDWSAASPDGSVMLYGLANVGVHVFGADCAFNLNWTDYS